MNIRGRVNYKEVLKGDTGFTYTPHVTQEGILYWTNNGNLPNPYPVNLHGEQGFYFTPHVDDEGNLSWSNNGNLVNPPTVNIKGEQGFYFTPHVSNDGILTWSNNGGLPNPNPFNISDLMINEVKEARTDLDGHTFNKLNERLNSDYQKLINKINNSNVKVEVEQARTATTGEIFNNLDDRIDCEINRLRESINITMLEQNDKEYYNIDHTIDGMTTNMIIKGKTIKFDNNEIKSFGQEEGKISILSHCFNLFNYKTMYTSDWIDDSGSINNSGDNKYYSIKVPIYKTNIKYYITGDVINRANVGYLNTDGRLISHKSYSISKTIELDVAPKGAIYILAYLNAQGYDNSISNGIMVSMDIPSKYSPYSDLDKKDILLSELNFDEGLRGVVSVCDELNSVENKAIKKIEKYILTGNEAINDTTEYDEKSGTEKYKVFTVGISNAMGGKESINNNFPEKIFDITFQNMDSEGLAVTQYGIYIKILKSKLPTQDTEGFKAWLKANTTTVYYALAEPIEIPLDENINVKSFNEKTYVSFENIIKGTSSFRIPVDTSKIINEIINDRGNLNKKYKTLSNEFEKIKTLMVSILPYKGDNYVK